ncbi:hypothetical protein ACFVT8_02685, partial [Lysinibacillus sp. NPDC058147]|uniref:hypothetical protein n=1 Tax=unclassified Lysinibacillus TaxID=2636778 RepID=UPI0036DCD2B1
TMFYLCESEAAATMFYLCESEAAATMFYLCESEAAATMFYLCESEAAATTHERVFSASLNPGIIEKKVAGCFKGKSLLTQPIFCFSLISTQHLKIQ